MSGSLWSDLISEPRPLELVPRMERQGYESQHVARRREWIEVRTGCQLTHIGCYSIPSEQMRGNIENPIGAAQTPLAIAGPLLVNGSNAQGTFYVPMATTEGALVRSYERGMVTLTRAGGVSARVHVDENRVSPVFLFQDVDDAYCFAQTLHQDFEAMRAEAEATTGHGKLLRIECHPIGREVIVNFCYFTADAQGMNMIVKATEHACQWIMRHSLARR